jgi:AcrR family transcriptional regulator
MMPNELLNKNQRRTKETQERLLEAAEEVFVRDGYDGAQLMAIASAAGRSKGALYGHFKSKEDLFLALFEYRSQQYVDRFLRIIAKCTNRKQRLIEFREFYVELVHDKAWAILTLEFKLFSLRHPDSKQRLRKALEMAVPTNNDELFHLMFGTLTRQQRSRTDLSILALGPVVSGLILESNFEPERLSDSGIRNLLGSLFDALFPVATT